MKTIIKTILDHPAFPAMVSGLVTLLITSIFNLLGRRELQKQLFFDRYFPERVKAYDALLENIPGMIKSLAAIKSQPPNDRPESLAKLSNQITLNCYKHRLWLEQSVINLLDQMLDSFQGLAYNSDKGALVKTIGNEDLDIIFVLFSKLNALLYEAIAVTSGTRLLDKKFRQLARPSLLTRLASFIRRDRKKNDKLLDTFAKTGWPS